jgi:hypothetical protein
LTGEQVTEVLAAIAVLSFIVERALALVFESNVFVDRLGTKGVKEPIALALSLLVCWQWKIDLLSIVLHGEHTRFLGILITAAVVAGGSKASLKLFRDVLGIGNQRAPQKHDSLGAEGKAAAKGTAAGAGA